MLSLEIKTPAYQYLLTAYKEYLQILGYADPTIQSWPIHLREFFHYLETRSILQIGAVEPVHINDFVKYIKQRKNRRHQSGGLSSSSINKIINAVNVFVRFLNSTGKYFLESTPQREENNIGERVILSMPEIKQLYESTFLPHRENSLSIGQRDRAIIAVFYGCGLRRSEAKNLNITDIDLQRRLIFVKKGKGNKQRYVPIAIKHLEDIKDYLQEGREWFLYNHRDRYNHLANGKPYQRKHKADDLCFFISQNGCRMTEFYQRLQQMKQRAGINKNITPHSLRHSIATHLLESGMDIEEIAKFLGHSSLDSTQIYTHIINQKIQKHENDEEF